MTPLQSCYPIITPFITGCWGGWVYPFMHCPIYNYFRWQNLSAKDFWENQSGLSAAFQKTLQKMSFSIFLMYFLRNPEHISYSFRKKKKKLVSEKCTIVSLLTCKTTFCFPRFPDGTADCDITAKLMGNSRHQVQI